MMSKNTIDRVSKLDFEIDEEKRPCTLSHQDEAIIYRMKLYNPREYFSSQPHTSSSLISFS
jgi:hypothetical protein